MSKAVAKLSPTQAALQLALQTASAAIKTAAGDMSFLKFSKAGEWIYGAEDTEVENGSLWAVDTNSFCMGFQAWGDDADLLGEVTHLVTDQPVLRGDLKEVGGEWKPLMGCTLVCISGEDEGMQVAYKVTSKGGIKALGKLMAAIVSRIGEAPEDGTYIPVVLLNKDSYKHKKYGKIYTPVIDVQEWTDEDELMGAEIEAPDDMLEDEPEPEPEPEPTPKKRTRKAKKVEPEPEVEEDDAIEGELVEEEEETPPPAKRRRRRTV